MHKMLLQAGACAAGCVSRRRLEGLMDADAQARAEALCPQWKSLLCAAFPYGGAAGDSRISLYARGADYHAVLRTRLEQAAEGLQAALPQNRFVFCADVSPFPEVRAAALAGLGKLGRQGLLITEKAGSLVFLGFLVTDADLPETGGEIVPCAGCGACVRACPGGALGCQNRFDEARCLSALTQKRGALTEAQTALVKQGGLLWGCDRCQLACPENRHITVPPLPEFAPQPDPEEGDFQLSDRQFRKRYTGRAFVWRGVQPLRRNAEILKEKEETNALEE